MLCHIGFSYPLFLQTWCSVICTGCICLESAIQLNISENRGKKILKVLSQPYYNTRCKVRQTWFQKELEGKDLSKLFENGDQLNQDHRRLMRMWDDAMDISFKKVWSSTKRIKGIDESIRSW